MNLKEVKSYVEGTIKEYFKPKVLKKFDEDTNGNLTYGGDLISANTKVSGKSNNAIETITDTTIPSNDGLYVEDLNPKIQEVDVKTDKINIAQKTVNKVGTFPLLDDPIKFYGDNQTTPSTTDLDETVTLRDKVTNYDQLEILMKPSNPVNTHPQRTLVNTKDIVFNPKEYNIKDGSIINIRYGADTTTDVNTNLYDSYVTAWMKNDRTMYFRELVNGLSKNAFDDPKSPMVKFKDFTSNNPTGIVLKTDNFKEGTSSVYFPHEGANQIAITRPELVFSDDFTAQCWVYAYNDSDPYSIIFGDANNSQFMFFLRDGAIGDNMSLSMGTTRLLDTGKKATYNQWMHYVAERYNGVLSLYENGHIIGQVNYTGTCNMSNFAMGQNASAGNTKFHGYIDSLYVFDEAKYKSTDFDVNTDIKTDNPVFGCLFEPETALENSQEWTITEINGINKESVIIDPMNYIDTNQGIQDTPVGELITKIGSKVPAHYLLCDGTEYNITDYPYLAQAIKDEFGTFNYYGGDGTTTFAVPNKPSGKFIKRLNPIMTSNTAPAGSILYSPSTAGKNLVYYAFKEQSYPGEGECWVCPGNSGYLGYEFVSHTTVNAYRLQPRLYMDSNTLISTPNSWDFQASNDLSTWDTLDSQTGITWSNTDEKKTFFFKNETPYKAYRIFVKINNGSNYVIIGNLQLGTTEVENSSFIKYEPTYFIGSINGKEEITDLTNGFIDLTDSNPQNITLNESIENFDKIEITGEVTYKSSGTRLGLTTWYYNVSDLKERYNNSDSWQNGNQLNYGNIIVDGNIGYILSLFKTENQLFLDCRFAELSSVITKMHVRIRGIKSIYAPDKAIGSGTN